MSREPPMSRDPRSPREPRGASEMRPVRRPYDHSPEPITRSRRGRSEAPSRLPARDPSPPRARDPRARRGSEIPGEWGYGGHPPPRDTDPRRGRGYSQDRDAPGRVTEGRYPPRSADTRRGPRDYHPGSGAAPTFVKWQDDDDPRFARPNRAQTQPIHRSQRHPSRGSPPPPRGRTPPPPRGRSRNYSPPPGPGPRPRSRSAAGPLPSRARSVPASRQSAPPARDSRSQDRGRSKSRSRAQKVASYAAVGAAARVALQAGAQAAYKLRDDPSPWVGPKGVRVASAALGAGIVDGIVGNKHSKMRRGGMRHQAMREATEFGLKQFVVQPMATGALRSKSKKR